MLKYLFFIVIGYLCGSMLFCQWVPQKFMKKDICSLSNDGNPGASNVFINCGVPMGMLCLMLDMIKGWLPVVLSLRYLNPQHIAFALTLSAPVFGHAFSLYHKFRGGKCIATGFGVMIGLFSETYTGWILAGLYILFSTVIKINPHRMRSICAYILFALSATPILIIRHKIAIALGFLLIDMVAIYKHVKSAKNS